MRKIFSSFTSYWAQTNSRFKTVAVFVGGAVASAVIGALVLGSPSWWSTTSDRIKLSDIIEEMTAIDSFVDRQESIYRRAWDRGPSLESESEQKGLFFTVDVACDGLRERAQAVSRYDSNLEEREFSQLRSRAERIYSRSICTKVQPPIYTVIEGTENNWRQYVAPPSETNGLPRQVRDSIDRYRNRCTRARGVYDERPCREDEYATEAY